MLTILLNQSLQQNLGTEDPSGLVVMWWWELPNAIRGAQAVQSCTATGSVSEQVVVVGGGGVWELPKRDFTQFRREQEPARPQAIVGTCHGVQAAQTCSAQGLVVDRELEEALAVFLLMVGEEEAGLLQPVS